MRVFRVIILALNTYKNPILLKFVLRHILLYLVYNIISWLKKSFSGFKIKICIKQENEKWNTYNDFKVLHFFQKRLNYFEYVI